MNPLTVHHYQIDGILLVSLRVWGARHISDEDHLENLRVGRIREGGKLASSSSM